jgi:hypothetical protein
MHVPMFKMFKKFRMFSWNSAVHRDTRATAW